MRRGAFGRMVALRGSAIKSVPIPEVAGRVRKIEPDSALLLTALSLGTCLGVESEKGIVCLKGGA